MKSVFITTVTGPDSAGIIKNLAEATIAFNGEWLTSKVMKLDGQFSALMKVSVDQDSEAVLKETLEADFPDLTFFFSTLAEPVAHAVKTVALEIDCIDRPGLTRDMNKILSDLDLAVEHMECNRLHVSSIGETVFMAKVKLVVVETIDAEDIAGEIETMADEVRVNIL